MRQGTNYIIICPFQYNSGDRGIDPRLKMAGAIDLLSGRRKILSDVFSQRFKCFGGCACWNLGMILYQVVCSNHS